MLFNSFHFILFFILVTITYYSLPQKYRWVLLLVASYYFYMCWRPVFIVLIIFSTFINYFLSLCIAREKDKKRKKQYLVLSLMINFGLLFLFKYSVFINETVMSLLRYFANLFYTQRGLSAENVTQSVRLLLDRYPAREFDIILPMGISFYTFQAASYTIDVYEGRIKPIRHYGIFSLFITFFPSLLRGPLSEVKIFCLSFIKSMILRRNGFCKGVS